MPCCKSVLRRNSRSIKTQILWPFDNGLFLFPFSLSFPVKKWLIQVRCKCEAARSQITPKLSVCQQTHCQYRINCLLNLEFSAAFPYLPTKLPVSFRTNLAMTEETWNEYYNLKCEFLWVFFYEQKLTNVLHSWKSMSLKKVIYFSFLTFLHHKMTSTFIFQRLGIFIYIFKRF